MPARCLVPSPDRFTVMLGEALGHRQQPPRFWGRPRAGVSSARTSFPGLTPAPQPGAWKLPAGEALCCGAGSSAAGPARGFWGFVLPRQQRRGPTSSSRPCFPPLGPNCEINLDDCASNPCDYGKCIDKINGYECTCEPGYTGEGRHRGGRLQPGPNGDVLGDTGMGRGAMALLSSSGGLLWWGAAGVTEVPGGPCPCTPTPARTPCMSKWVIPAQAKNQRGPSAGNSTPGASTPMGIGLLPCLTGLFDHRWKKPAALIAADPAGSPLAAARAARLFVLLLARSPQ